MVTEPREKQLSAFQRFGLNVKKLEEVTMEAMSSWFYDRDHPENIAKKPFLKEIFQIAKTQERYKCGGMRKPKITVTTERNSLTYRTAVTCMAVTYFSSLVEEDDAEDDLDDEPPTLSVAPSVPTSPAFAEELPHTV
jgi:hypothetical protein